MASLLPFFCRNMETANMVSPPSISRERRKQRRLGRRYPRGKRTQPVTASTRERRNTVPRWAGEISLSEEGQVFRS